LSTMHLMAQLPSGILLTFWRTTKLRAVCRRRVQPPPQGRLGAALQALFFQGSVPPSSQMQKVARPRSSPKDEELVRVDATRARPGAPENPSCGWPSATQKNSRLRPRIDQSASDYFSGKNLDRRSFGSEW